MFQKKINNILNEGYNNKLYTNKGAGPYIYFGKKKYFDLSYGSGTLILGHNSKTFKNSLTEINKKNISLFTEPNIYANLLSKKLKHINKNYNKFIFCNSGTEAVFKSLRIVKAITKKNIIVSVTGSWHGSTDKLLFRKNKNFIVPMSDGLSENDRKNIKFIDYNNIEKSKNLLEKLKNKISCIIIEPIQGCLPDPKAIDYLKFLENFSKKNKTILIFDEIITGLRTKKGSVQNYYNIKPDISLFGKSYGGGYPIGMIAINKKVENIINKKKLNIFYGGTFSANAMACYSGNKTTSYIWKNKKIVEKQCQFSEYFQEELNSFIEKHKIDAKVYRFQSMTRIIFSRKQISDRVQRDFFENRNKSKIRKLKNFLLTKKILYPKNGIIFFSDANTNKHIKFFIKNISLGLKKYFI